MSALTDFSRALQRYDRWERHIELDGQETVLSLFILPTVNSLGRGGHMMVRLTDGISQAAPIGTPEVAEGVIRACQEGMFRPSWEWDGAKDWDTIFVLGAPDPEMEEITDVLHKGGVPYSYALQPNGERVNGRTAYQHPSFYVPESHSFKRVVAVECDPAVPDGVEVVHIDHHRPGDPGYGRPSTEFLSASSIGQVLKFLAGDGAEFYFQDGKWYMGEEEVFIDHILAAAADHCLAHAYHGECPGVDPDELMQWRIEKRAFFQGRGVGDVLSDIRRARLILKEASEMYDIPGVKDLRDRHVAELPEAAAREGVAYVATVSDRDGHKKLVLGSASPEQVEAFENWAQEHTLTGIYGDPARGFAGAYLPDGGE